MKGISSFKNSLVIITVTVILILGTQIYRTVNTYQLNKQRFENDVQLALDLSVEKYYADKARSHFAVMTRSDGDSVTSHISTISMMMDTLEIDGRMVLEDSDHVHANGTSFSYAWSSDSEDVNVQKRIRKFSTDSSAGTIVQMTTTELDTSRDFKFAFADFTQLTQKIMISTSEERLDTEKLSALLAEEFKRRNIKIGYQVNYESSAFGRSKVSNTDPSDYSLFTQSKSTYLLPGESLGLNFENATLQILKRGAFDLLLSFAIVFSVIGALLYLYRVIQNQKELAMIKDDLIGNVTHEFKTPIATVTTALEGIANFNKQNDPKKTKRYIDMSRDQLTKLNLMVEKLMETATIDSGEMEINRIETDVTDLASKVISNARLTIGDKVLKSNLPEKAILRFLDPFHIENVLSNLIDNASKYGGSEIIFKMEEKEGRLIFQVIDDGPGIGKSHQQKIFEKLYRVPQGNQHDIKGFGIGLYYTKAIIEKHDGQISLDVSPGRTCFTVTL